MAASASDRRRIGVLLLALFAMIACTQALFAGGADTFALQRSLPSLEQLTAGGPAMRRAAPAPAAAGQTAASAPICDLFANGFDSAGATQCAACFDRTTNFFETSIDCGGPYCKSCNAGGQPCTTNSECGSGLCSSGFCTAEKCLTNDDCSPTPCNPATFVCEPASCVDGMKDGSESGVDCGGPTCSPCQDNQQCNTGADCASGVCTTGTCTPATCADLRQNGTETDVDCGGGCLGCGENKQCKASADCASFICRSDTHTCSPGTCADETINNGETDIDCGGDSGCTRCSTDKACAVDGDCLSGVCDTGTHTCSAATCSDGRKNGSESDVDCGGDTCGQCGIGQACATYLDCASNACIDHTCQ